MKNMKKKLVSMLAAVTLLAAGCTTQGLVNGTGSTSSTSTTGGLGDILGSVVKGIANQNTVNGLLNLVIGSVKLDVSELYGNWTYAAPACAFTSENLLAKAGGSVAAANVNEKLKSAYSGVGISASNTQLTFTQDGKFSGKIDGMPLSGTYSYDPSNCALKMQLLGGLLSATGYLTRTTNGVGLTFESKKLLSLLQTVAQLSGNSTLQTVGDLSKQFDGVRVGFDLAKK